MVPLKISTHGLPGPPLPEVHRTQKLVSTASGLTATPVSAGLPKERQWAVPQKRAKKMFWRPVWGAQSHWDRNQASPLPFAVNSALPLRTPPTAHQVLTHPRSRGASHHHQVTRAARFGEAEAGAETDAGSVP